MPFRMATTPTSSTSSSRQPRLLTGLGNVRQSPKTATKAGTAREASASFTATLPMQRPAPQSARRPAPTAVSTAALPRWALGVVIGGVLLAVGMPVSVLMSRSMLVQEVLAEQSSSKAALVCTAGDARAVDGSSLVGWLFGGSYFSCGEWETREARVQRERDRAQANYLARERARQGLQ